ncbi:MAG TPA: protein kinase [Thermoanaerobaculia bacterium]|nr:protein kinase [Thermoanaerobaculia bacterium]
MARSRSTGLVFALGMIPVVLGLLALTAWETKRTAERRVGFTPEDTASGLVAAVVHPGSPAERGGLRAGDVIRAVNGRPLHTLDEYEELASGFRPEMPLAFKVERGGRALTLSIVSGTPFPWGRFLGNAFALAAYLAVGLWALLRRPGYLRANLLAAFCLAVAVELAIPLGTFGSLRVAAVSWFVYYLVVGLEFGLAMHLAATIPDRRSWVARHPWALPALYAVGLGLALAVCAAKLAEIAGHPSVLPWHLEAAERLFSWGLLTVWAVAFPLVLLGPALRYPDPEGRREAGIVLAGTVPWALYIPSSTVVEWMEKTLPAWLYALEEYAILGFPLAIALVLYRETKRRDELVLGLADGIHRLDSLADLSDLVGTDLAAAFHPRSIHLLRQSEVERISEKRELVRILERQGEPLEFSEDFGLALPPEERAWLDRLAPRLLVPLLGGDRRLTGLLLLGEKTSGEPYTTRDRKVLRTIAGPMGLVYDNARLQERAEQDRRVRRDVLDRLEGRGIDLMRECPVCGGCFDPEAEVCPRDGGEPAPALPVERTLAGRYRLDRRLGRGGMGAVYEALDVHLRRPVAVKILLPGPFDDAEALRRFEREARISARLNHPNVVAVHDFGTTETGVAFLVLELLSGLSLREALVRAGAIDPRTVARWLREVCAGVRAAHEARVIHRDLKPENVFISRTEGGAEIVKLLDFGVARAVSPRGLDATSPVTVPGTVLGTLAYMPPEQLNGQVVDERGDLFALGVIAFEMVCGRPPFTGRSPVEILQAMLRGEVAALPGDGPEVRRLEAVLRRCLSKLPWDRHPTVAALEAELIPALEACPPLGRPAVPAGNQEVTRRLPSR